MREISLDRLKTLVAVADSGSFADAAQALHLSPPTVSLHVADLEARVGALLLTRKRGEVRPTSVGEVLVERARRLLADAEQTLEDIERHAQGLAGRVRIGASTGAIAHLLPQALEAVRLDHPDIDVQVAILTSQETLDRLRRGVGCGLGRATANAGSRRRHQALAARSGHGVSASALGWPQTGDA